MKILVATKYTQGMRPNDICQANEGEWVLFPVDGKCENIILEHLVGIVTNGRTTTFRTAEIPTSPADYMNKIMETKQRHYGGTIKPDVYDHFIKEAIDLLGFAADHDEDCILEFNLMGKIEIRKKLPVFKAKLDSGFDTYREDH